MSNKHSNCILNCSLSLKCTGKVGISLRCIGSINRFSQYISCTFIVVTFINNIGILLLLFFCQLDSACENLLTHLGYSLVRNHLLVYVSSVDIETEVNRQTEALCVVFLLKGFFVSLIEYLEVTAHVVTYPKLERLFIIHPCIVDILACSISCDFKVTIAGSSYLKLAKTSSVSCSTLPAVLAVVSIGPFVCTAIVCCRNRLIENKTALAIRNELNHCMRACLSVCTCFITAQRDEDITVALCFAKFSRTFNKECESTSVGDVSIFCNLLAKFELILCKEHILGKCHARVGKTDNQWTVLMLVGTCVPNELKSINTLLECEFKVMVLINSIAIIPYSVEEVIQVAVINSWQTGTVSATCKFIVTSI